MNRQTPWHKEFWPWFIIVLIGSVLIASAVTIRLALKYDDAPAAGHYQKQGLGIVAREAVTVPAEQSTSGAKEAGARAQ